MFKLPRKKSHARSEPLPDPEDKAEIGGHDYPDAASADESIPTHVLEKIRKDGETLANDIEEIKKEICFFRQTCERQNEIAENCIKITNECQRNTEKFVNHELQRHILHPAIEVVAMLADHIGQLDQEVQRITAKNQICELFHPLHEIVAQSAIVAQQQMEHLDMHWITPCEFDDVDGQYHEIKQTLKVEDKNLHGKVKCTLIAGLLYRDTVLPRAQVSVYRFEKNNTQTKGNQNEHT